MSTVNNETDLGNIAGHVVNGIQPLIGDAVAGAITPLIKRIVALSRRGDELMAQRDDLARRLVQAEAERDAAHDRIVALQQPPHPKSRRRKMND